MNGRRDDRLAGPGHRDEALGHRAVQAQRRVGVDDGHEARLALQRRAVDAARDAGDLDRVLDDLCAEGQALPGLVEGRRERSVHVEVAGLDRQVRRLEGAAALLVDDVERPDHPDVVLEIREVAGPPASIDIGDEGRPAHGPEDEVAIPEDAGCARDFARGARSATAPSAIELLGLLGLEPDPPGRPATRGIAGRRAPRGRPRPRSRSSAAAFSTSTPTSRRIWRPARWIASTWSALRSSSGVNGLTIRRHGRSGTPPPTRRSRRGRLRRSSGLSGTGPRYGPPRSQVRSRSRFGAASRHESVMSFLSIASSTTSSRTWMAL